MIIIATIFDLVKIENILRQYIYTQGVDRSRALRSRHGCSRLLGELLRRRGASVQPTLALALHAPPPDRRSCRNFDFGELVLGGNKTK